MRAVKESDVHIFLRTSASPLGDGCESLQQKAYCEHDSCSCVVTESLLESLSLPVIHASLGENADSQRKVQYLLCYTYFLLFLW